jgi:antitoxin HicB
MWRYPVVLTRDDNDTILVSVPDIPEVHTFGEDEDEALARAVDAIITALDARVADREVIPTPSAIASGAPRVQLPALIEAKLVLYQMMRQQHVNKYQLARRLGVHLPQIDRLVDLRHHSRLDQIEAAFGSLGYAMGVSITPSHEATPAMSKRHVRARGAGTR